LVLSLLSRASPVFSSC